MPGPEIRAVLSPRGRAADNCQQADRQEKEAAYHTHDVEVSGTGVVLSILSGKTDAYHWIMDGAGQ
ncbi:hypothetical protein AA0614_0010 [Komagataeibacter saccharivorans NRIC 0614]|nr:hypothetical protein AA0614_0010 [Komagataeibacter saccharivorans NRIC 0614]